MANFKNTSTTDKIMLPDQTGRNAGILAIYLQCASYAMAQIIDKGVYRLSKVLGNAIRSGKHNFK